MSYKYASADDAKYDYVLNQCNKNTLGAYFTQGLKLQISLVGG